MKKIILVYIYFLSSFAMAYELSGNDNQNLFLDGYIDGSYNYLSRNNKFSSGVNNRTYDINPNGFTLHQASFSLSYQPQHGLGFLINPVIGRDPTIFAPYGWSHDLTKNRIGIAPLQAYLQYKKNDLTIIGGQMINSANHDSPVPTQERQFSRSILWTYSTPTTNFGLQATYRLNELITLGAGVNNGWDNIRDFHRPPTLMFSIDFTPNDNLDFIINVFSGGQRATDYTSTGTIGRRTLIDLLLSLAIRDDLKLIINYDYDVQDKSTLPNGTIGEAVWGGLATYLDYDLSNQWRISLRSEIFSDHNGFVTGVAQTLKEATFTVGYLPTKYFEVRAETRYDISNKKSYITSDSKKPSYTQKSFALEGIYKF